VPERLTVSEGPGLPVYAWLAPADEVSAGDGVMLRLHRSQEAARRVGLTGWQRLVEQALAKDFAWLERDLRRLARHGSLYAPLGSVDELQASALAHARRFVLPDEPPPAISQAAYDRAVTDARARLTGLAHQLDTHVGAILTQRQQLAARLGPPPSPAPSPGQRAKPTTLSGFNQLKLPVSGAAISTAVKPATALAAELVALVPKDFLALTPFTQLQHLPRYLRALELRAERADNDLRKDADRARQLAPYAEAWRQLAATKPKSVEAARLHDEFRWMVEEFKVSLFAQELRTVRPVSAKRLDELLERVRAAGL